MNDAAAVKALVDAAQRIVKDYKQVASGTTGINDLTLALAPFEHRYEGIGGMAGPQRSARCSCGWSYIVNVGGHAGVGRTSEDEVVRAWARHVVESGGEL